MPVQVRRRPTTIQSNPDTTGASGATAYTNPNSALGNTDGAYATKSNSLILQSGAFSVSGFNWRSAPGAGEIGGAIPVSTDIHPNAVLTFADIGGGSRGSAVVRWKLSTGTTDNTTTVSAMNAGGTLGSFGENVNTTSDRETVTGWGYSGSLDAFLTDNPNNKVQVKAVRGSNAIQPTYTHQVDSFYWELYYYVDVPVDGAATDGGSLASGVVVEVRKAAQVIDGSDGSGIPAAVVTEAVVTVIEGELLTSARSVDAISAVTVLTNDEALVNPTKVVEAREGAAVAEGEELRPGTLQVIVSELATIIEGAAGSSSMLEVVTQSATAWIEGSAAVGSVGGTFFLTGAAVEGNQVLLGGQITFAEGLGLMVEGNVAAVAAFAFSFGIGGFVLDSSGNPLEGATVWLFTTADQGFVAETTSAADGSYAFQTVSDPIEYFVRGHLDDPERLFGTTDRNLPPVITTIYSAPL
jgi:hypothetical protein